MSGSNGNHPVVNLTERQKCAAHPSKRRYSTGEEAGRAARESSKRSGLEIAPYLCATCGYYHLTKSVGGDSIQLLGGKFSVGEFASRAERVDMPEEAPVVPGDHETRMRFAREYLESNPEPTSAELCEAIGGCTKDTLRKVMKDLGYHNTRGRNARWVKNAEPDTRKRLDLSHDNDAPESPSDWPQHITRPASRVIENLDRIRHVALGDLIESYAAAGLTLVLTLEDSHG